MTALLIIGVLAVAAVTFGVCIWGFDKFDVPLCDEGCKDWGCEHPKVSGIVDDIKPGSSNGRATGLHPVDGSSILSSGTVSEAGWHYASGCDPVWLTPIAGSNPVIHPAPGA